MTNDFRLRVQVTAGAAYSTYPGAVPWLGAGLHFQPHIIACVTAMDGVNATVKWSSGMAYLGSGTGTGYEDLFYHTATVACATLAPVLEFRWCPYYPEAPWRIYLEGAYVGTSQIAAWRAGPGDSLLAEMVVRPPQSPPTTFDVELLAPQGWDSDWDTYGANAQTFVQSGSGAIAWDNVTGRKWTNLRCTGGAYTALYSRLVAVRPPAIVSAAQLDGEAVALYHADVHGWVEPNPSSSVDPVWRYMAANLLPASNPDLTCVRGISVADGDGAVTSAGSVPAAVVSGYSQWSIHQGPMVARNGWISFGETNATNRTTDTARSSATRGATLAAYAYGPYVYSQASAMLWLRDGSQRTIEPIGWSAPAAAVRTRRFVGSTQQASDTVASPMPSPRAGSPHIYPYLIERPTGELLCGWLAGEQQTEYASADAGASWSQRFIGAMTGTELAGLSSATGADGTELLAACVVDLGAVAVTWRTGAGNNWPTWVPVAEINYPAWPVVWQDRCGRWVVAAYVERTWRRWRADHPGGTWSEVSP